MQIIILLEKYGNNCNRLFQSLHYHAYAIDKKHIFINFSILGLTRFDGKLFDLIDGVRNILLLILSKLFISSKNDYFAIGNKNNYIKFVKGWNFRVDYLTKKYRPILKDIYNFKSKKYIRYSNCIRKFFDNLKSQKKFIIGVHIRRGDYKNWNDGGFYFKDSVYNNLINYLKDYFATNQVETIFVVVSNEKISNRVNYDFKISGNWKEDQITLQNCDLIIGPPSTFTLWASYISKKPYIFIDENGNLNMQNQSICDG